MISSRPWGITTTRSRCTATWFAAQQPPTAAQAATRCLIWATHSAAACGACDLSGSSTIFPVPRGSVMVVVKSGQLGAIWISGGATMSKTKALFDVPLPLEATPACWFG